jgi:CRP/FNR family transcriptional regulator, anaerobic regulatory protein
MTAIVKLETRHGPAWPGLGEGLRPASVPVASGDTCLHAIFEGAPVESFTSGRTVFWEGDRAEHVVKVVEGVLRICRILPNGRRAITGFGFAGDLLGLSFKDLYLFSAEAITPVKVMKVSRRRLDGFLAEAPQGQQIVCDHVRDELCAAQDQMVILVHQSAEARLAGFLFHVARRLLGDLRAGAEFDLAMPRSDIADHLGLTMETVCRSMTRLRKTGWIGMSGPHRIRICDPLKLAELAGAVDGAGGDRARV